MGLAKLCPTQDPVIDELDVLMTRSAPHTYVPYQARLPQLRDRHHGAIVGARISSLRGMKPGGGPLGLGRLGAFAVSSTARTWQNLVLLSNAHVLRAHAARAGDAVYRPKIVANEPQVLLKRDSLQTLALLTSNSFDGHHSFAHGDSKATDFYIDCATATLADTQAQPSGPRGFGRVDLATPKDTRPGRRLPVRLFGIHDRSAGFLVDTAATVPHADGRMCRNSLIIETPPGCAPFASDGDSGALVVDSFDRAIGLLWGVDLTKPTRAFACHLLPVLDRLDLVLSKNESAQ